MNKSQNKEDCFCTVYCGDDPRIQTGEVKPCQTYQDRVEKNKQIRAAAEIINNTPHGIINGLLRGDADKPAMIRAAKIIKAARKLVRLTQ